MYNETDNKPANDWYVGFHCIKVLIQQTLAVLSMTDLKQQKSFGFFSSSTGCNRSHILHSWPSGVLEKKQLILAVLDVSLNSGP